MSQHAKALGYDARDPVPGRADPVAGQPCGGPQLRQPRRAEAGQAGRGQTADRPIPMVSFVARQRDLRELVGEHLPGAEQLEFADVLNWWEARFDQPSRSKTAICRPLRRSGCCGRSRPRPPRQLQEAFEKTARVREEVMNTLLTRTGDREMFRQVYPFSPALVQTLMAVSSLLQRERTALKLMLQLTGRSARQPRTGGSRARG